MNRNCRPGDDCINGRLIFNFNLSQKLIGVGRRLVIRKSQLLLMVWYLIHGEEQMFKWKGK